MSLRDVFIERGEEQLDRLKESWRREKITQILLFRLVGEKAQRAFESHSCAQSAPRLLLHGNPHLENFSRTHHGSGLIDFDRARVGPYGWDIVRFLGSLAFWHDQDEHLSKRTKSRFFQAYTYALTHPLAYWGTPDVLRKVALKKSQLNMERYLHKGKKWAQKLKDHPIALDDPLYKELFTKYKTSLPPTHLSPLIISQQGMSVGSMGKKHHLFLLRDPSDHLQPKLIDIKETYSEPDTEHFTNPFPEQGVRMIHASHLYAPSVEQGQGHCQVNGMDYWAREIPSFHAKIPDQITLEDQEQLAHIVGLQLGRGHRIAGEDPLNTLKHIQAHFEHFYQLSMEMNQEINHAYQALVTKHKVG